MSLSWHADGSGDGAAASIAPAEERGIFACCGALGPHDQSAPGRVFISHAGEQKDFASFLYERFQMQVPPLDVFVDWELKLGGHNMKGIHDALQKSCVGENTATASEAHVDCLSHGDVF
jgi:hypothetical protein